MWKKLMTILTTAILSLAMSTCVFAGDMYRFYNPYSGEHFYTASYEEGSSLSRSGWKYEGIGWVAPDHSNTPVYRLYNSGNGDHHYTTNAAERNTLTNLGWRYEGIGWYSDDRKTVPMYRLFNPNASTGAHNFTANAGEYQALARIGWKQEGIAWYASAGGRAGKEIRFPEPVKTAVTTKSSGSSAGTASGSGSSTRSTGTVYWTPGGKRYHSTRSCVTLRRSRTIYSGSVANAGGRTPCQRCW